jgi:molybdate transport system ATP-binding protein
VTAADGDNAQRLPSRNDATGAPGPVLSIRATRQVHPGLGLDITLDLPASGRGVVFGPSGCGKTSLLRLVAGLDPPDSGSIRLDNRLLDDPATRVHVPMRHRQIGLIHQDDRLFPHLDARANITFGLAGWTRDAREQRLAEVAHLAGVTNLLTRPIDRLSGGERQRVGLARALAPRPRLLLCDEPVSALDLESRFLLLDRLRHAAATENVPLLYVTHAPAEAVALGARVFLMLEGRIAADGPALDVLAAAADSFHSPGTLEGLRNVLPARVADHEPGHAATILQLDAGPTLVVPYTRRAIGDAVRVLVRADDILLGTGQPERLSARNLLTGQVVRVVPHAAEAEVVVRTGSLEWIVSVVAPAVASLGLTPGLDVLLIIKARSCHLADPVPHQPPG